MKYLILKIRHLSYELLTLFLLLLKTIKGEKTLRDTEYKNKFCMNLPTCVTLIPNGASIFREEI